jgi:hypothetical protein
MYPEASQERMRMVSRSVSEGGIRVTASPCQDGSTVNDEITSPNESSSDGMENGEHEEGLVQRSASSMAAFALLGWARNAGKSLFVQRQATGQSQSRPTLEPVVPILIG